MHTIDAAEARARFNDAAYTQRIARARFRREPNPNGLSFRAWARRSYNFNAAAGKLRGLLALERIS
jgi:hypothetical protein